MRDVPGFLPMVAALAVLACQPLQAQTLPSQPITVADASLAAAFYSDSSCLLTIDSHTQSGKTVIDANVDGEDSRMLIHCDTDDGRRLTLLARGDALSVAQRAELLSREQIEEGEQGMIAWLTRSGVHYSDDSAPRRYVIGGSVYLRKSPPIQVAGNALHSQRHAFGRVVGLLEPLLKPNDASITKSLPSLDDEEDEAANADSAERSEDSESATDSSASGSADATDGTQIDEDTEADQQETLPGDAVPDVEHGQTADSTADNGDSGTDSENR